MSGKIKRLNESKRLEVISELNQPNLCSKQSTTRQYRVSENKVWLKLEDICKCSVLMSEEAKKKTFRASVGRFTEVKDKLYL